jgi:hypothetical protein
MAKRPTTIRLDDTFRKKALQKAKKDGFTLTDAVYQLLAGYVRGDIEIGVTQYPKWFLDKIHKELDDMEKLRKLGKLKSYHSAKELFDDILDR